MTKQGHFVSGAATLCACLMLPTHTARGQAAGSGVEPRLATYTPAEAAKSPEARAEDEQFSPVSWRWGDWRGFFSFTAQLRYDDNILQLDQNAVSDFIGVASPAFNLEYIPAGREDTMLLHLDYTPQFVGYLEHDEFNTINHAAHVKAERTLGRSQFTLSHTLLLTTDPTVEQTTRGEIHEEISELSFAYQATDKTTLTLTPHQDWSSVEDGITVWEYGGTLAVGYRYSEKLDLLGSYDAAEVTSDPGVDGFKQSVLAGFSWEMSALCQLDFMAGVQYYTFSGDDASGDSITPQISLIWGYQFAPKTALRINLSYDNNVSQYTAYQMNETIQGQAVVTHELTPKIGLELRGGGGVMRQETTAEDRTSGGDLPYWNIGAGLVYHYSPRTSLRLDVSHQDRGSNELYSPFKRNVVQIEITHRF